MGRIILALVSGFVVVAGLSLATDEVLHLVKVYPPWGEPMYDPGLNALALSYRIVYTILGGWVTAKVAPPPKMRVVLIGATLGLLLGTAGAIGAIVHGGLGPDWYPIAVAVTGFPCSWLGGYLYCRPQPSSGVV